MSVAGIFRHGSKLEVEVTGASAAFEVRSI
jgi:hypothetical protein